MFSTKYLINELNQNFLTFNFQKFGVFSSLLLEEYFGIFIFFIIATVISLIIAIASYSLTNQVPELEKLSPYECGFETYEAPRVKFDIKFCVIAILLIIFDVEMMYLFPWCVSVSKISMLGTWSMIDFIIELTFGYVYVLEKKALEW
uniref:NADH dehydrogenase subunit 3 n=1 Tax=Haslea pseudostrearia TaxID=197756 RepID=UPI00220D0627|nr:NADH dehydrogenase subunit 3 [Haslea pseudostrearia]UXN44215.1 NADH dehydrogenase subunit 3 [Haslea pseudostrearia]